MSLYVFVLCAVRVYLTILGAKMNINEKRWTLFKETVVERCAIYIRKELQNKPAPWTDDPIFRTYRFCNVFRDLDKTYKLLAELPRDTNNKYYWATRLMLRWSSSEQFIKETVANKESVRLLLEGNAFELDGFVHWATTSYKGPLVTGSFIVKRPGGAEGDRYMLRSYYEGIADLDIPSWKGKTIKACGKLLRDKLPWCGSFTAYCLLSDLMYEDGPLATAPDLYKYAEKGPGGIRGMAHLLGVDPGYISTQVWEKYIQLLRQRWEDESSDMVLSLMAKVGESYPAIEGKIRTPMALDVEHWLCEYYKYVRGTAKRKYLYKE